MTAVKGKSLLTIDARTKKRNAQEARFRAYGFSAIAVAVVALVILLTSVLTAGLSAFQQTYITLELPLPEETLDKSGVRDPEVMAKVSTIGYAKVLRNGFVAQLTDLGIESGMSDKDAGADLIGTTLTIEVLASGRIDGYFKGRVSAESAALDKNTSPEALVVADQLVERGVMVTKFNWAFLTAPDASDQRPEAAGLGVAILGSLYMMLVVLCLALPIGVQKPLDRRDRGEHIQPRRRPIHRLRHPWACDLHQLRTV